MMTRTPCASESAGLPRGAADDGPPQADARITNIRKKPRGTIWNVHFHPDGFLIGTDSGHEGGHLMFWKVDAPNEFFDFKLPNLCYDSDLHPDKLRMVTAHQDNVLRLWRMAAAG